MWLVVPSRSRGVGCGPVKLANGFTHLEEVHDPLYHTILQRCMTRGYLVSESLYCKTKLDLSQGQSLRETL